MLMSALNNVKISTNESENEIKILKYYILTASKSVDVDEFLKDL